MLIHKQAELATAGLGHCDVLAGSAKGRRLLLQGRARAGWRAVGREPRRYAVAVMQGVLRMPGLRLFQSADGGSGGPRNALAMRLQNCLSGSRPSPPSPASMFIAFSVRLISRLLSSASRMSCCRFGGHAV
jgi:hypothetical protein